MKPGTCCWDSFLFTLRIHVLDSSVLTHHVQRDHVQRESLEVRGTQT